MASSLLRSVSASTRSRTASRWDLGSGWDQGLGTQGSSGKRGLVPNPGLTPTGPHAVSRRARSRTSIRTRSMRRGLTLSTSTQLPAAELWLIAYRDLK